MWRLMVGHVTHHLLVDCKLNRLLGWYSRFLPVSQGAQTTSTGFLRPTSEVQDSNQSGEMRLPSTQGHLPRLQDVCRGFPTSGRTSNIASGLNNLPRPPVRSTINWACSIYIGDSCPTRPHTRHHFTKLLRIQSQGLLPHHLDTGTLQGLRKVHGKFVTRHSNVTPRSISATYTCHRRLQVYHVCCAPATHPERLTDPRLQ
jgi:hypothetical protein